LTFASYCDDGAGHTGSSSTTRVVVADDDELARKIGEAMLGEEIAASEHLTEVLSVEETNEDPEVLAWTKEGLNQIWSRALRKLNDPDVLVVSLGDKHVGITKRPVQTC